MSARSVCPRCGARIRWAVEAGRSVLLDPVPRVRYLLYEASKTAVQRNTYRQHVCEPDDLNRAHDLAFDHVHDDETHKPWAMRSEAFTYMVMPARM